MEEGQENFLPEQISELALADGTGKDPHTKYRHMRL